MSKWEREGRTTRASAAAAAAAAEPAAAAKRLQAPLGQDEVLARWLRLARRRTLPHGFLVAGAPGVGKSTVIDTLTAALLCPSTLDLDGPCGVCRTCARVANRLHPDVHVLDLAQDDADRETWKKSFYVIKVDQVRAAQSALARHAVEGGARVLVVADADCLEEAGQNALLKTLEEPGAATFLLLEASRPEQLLPTIHSRVQRLQVRPLPEATIRRELFLRAPARAAHHDDAVRLARGSLGAALEACTEHVVQIHHLVHAMLAEPDRLRPVATARAALASAEERRHEIDAARTFLWVLRAELAARLHALAAEQAPTYPPACAEPWTTWLERTLAAERDLDLLIPPEQVLTACLVSFSAG